LKRVGGVMLGEDTVHKVYHIFGALFEIG